MVQAHATDITKTIVSDFSTMPEIVAIPNLVRSPAFTHRPTGVVYLNQMYQGVFPEDTWFYIVEHERGHIKNKNNDELAADAYASAAYLKRYGRQPSKAVAALTKVLPDTQLSRQRVQAQVGRSLQHDCAVNKYAPACQGSSFSGYVGDPFPNEISAITSNATQQQISANNTGVKQAQIAAGVASKQIDNSFILAMQQTSGLSKVQMAQLQMEFELEKMKLGAEIAAAQNQNTSPVGLANKNLWLMLGGGLLVFILIYSILD